MWRGSTPPPYYRPPLSVTRALLFEGESDNRSVGLLYATSRKASSPGSVSYSHERSSSLNFGAVRVRVPEKHKIGVVERPWEYGIFGIKASGAKEDKEKHFIIDKTVSFDRTKFVEYLKRTTSEDPHVLIFVHGFNTSFEESAFRLAQIVWNTQFRGVPILFSWPSRGGVLSYPYDRESATFSRGGFLDLVQLVQSNTRGPVHVALAAHSMGNQVVVEATGKRTAASAASSTYGSGVGSTRRRSRRIYEF